MEVLGVGPDETWMVGDNLEMGNRGAPTARHLCDLARRLRRRATPHLPDLARPNHPPLVGIAAVAELLGAPAFFAGIAPRRSGNLSALPMAISSASDLINRVVRADAAHARHNAGRLPHNHPKSTTNPKFPGDLRTSKSVPNPAGGPCLPDY
jgi:hypothetical protein